ncbi:uncharacterized protein (DUF1501 family) [Prosthecobacter fusiformis]|uniref:Uncharacterized protein (DUF1501 family) n=1 Tax=Prosthecobacter fusiformis TaxID=48464 RepID=A0A4R7SQN0_9BACT|nr:DUF1501 domain-containing protein [Prosthecobacter fusiformis]TDU80726.1 uncharacterized protein (DUF1501 family) [Prosthecobacter fusiformis]
MKNRKHQDHFDTRRNFLCRSACAGLGVTSVVNTLAHLRLVQSAIAQSAPTDYKAIVCLFLNGGNDSNNMLVPLDGVARTNYDSARPSTHPIHISPTAALPLTAPAGGFGQSNATGFGVHPSMTNTQSLFNSGDLAFVANIGTLVEPITRAEYVASPRVIPVPPQLFSHSDQQLQWQSSLPDKPFQNGWGGRAAELLNNVANPDSKVSMNISIAGQNSFQVGSSVVQYAVGTSGVVGLSGYNKSSGAYFGTGTYGHAANYSVNPVAYAPNDPGRTLQALDTITKLTRMQLGETESHYQHHLEEGYNDVMKRARDNEALVGSSLSAATTAIDNAFAAAFPGVTTLPDIANQMKMVARLIQGRSSLENNRQIFFVSMGGYDTHQNQEADHATLMGNLDKALKGFKSAVDAITTAEGTGNLWNDTMVFTQSDFTRTLQPNGGVAASGTDHGWGGHHIVMGGSIIGKKIYGSFPDLARATGQDVDSNRGRWIPGHSVDQYSSVIAKWFMSQGTSYIPGITGANINDIFPNLGRFQNSLTIPSELGFVDFTV